jgi:predicted nucleotidyltransferase
MTSTPEGSKPSFGNMKLTSRQKLLLSRLVALGQDSLDRRLPVEVIEILGFGSLLRGKTQPKDVDLLIRCTREYGRAFASFRNILEPLCRDVRYRYDFDRPLAAFLDEYDRRHADMLPGLVPVDEERALFSQWLEPYSWHMLFPKSFGALYGWDDPFGFTRRLLRRTLPNLNVIYYIYPDTTPEQIGLRAGFTEVIWSREQPDMEQNCLNAMAPDRAIANTRKELQNFDRQLFLLRATLTLLEPLARTDSQRNGQTVGPSLRSTLLEPDILLNEDEVRAELGRSYQCADYTDTNACDLATLVEQQRTEVKELWSRVEALREVIRLRDWHAGS